MAPGATCPVVTALPANLAPSTAWLASLGVVTAPSANLSVVTDISARCTVLTAPVPTWCADSHPVPVQTFISASPPISTHNATVPDGGVGGMVACLYTDPAGHPLVRHTDWHLPVWGGGGVWELAGRERTASPSEDGEEVAVRVRHLKLDSRPIAVNGQPVGGSAGPV